MMLRKLLINTMLFVAISGGLGFATAHYAIESGTRFVTRQAGPWKQWTMLGRSDADPYARAYMARKGLVPVAATVEQAYFADSDSAGGWLNTSCEYRVVVGHAKGGWWSIAAYSKKGMLVANAADRYAFNVDTAMPEVDGRAVVTLARDARPGNWLPIGGSGPVTVVLSVQPSPEQEKSGLALPEIERIGCR